MAQLPLPERWVISRLHTLTANVTDQLENYDFGPAGDLVRCWSGLGLGLGLGWGWG